LFAQFATGFGGNQPTIEDAMSLVLAALALLALGIFGPGIANGIVSGGPQLGAGAAVGTGLAAGGIVAAGVAGAGLGAGALAGAARGSASVAAAASAPFRSGGIAGVGRLSGSAMASSPNSVATGSPPAWAAPIKRSQALSHAASAATHAIRSGDQGGGGASVDLSQDER
jgi:type IV secretory pathway TrbL component